MDVNKDRRDDDGPYPGPVMWIDKRDTLVGDISRKGNLSIEIVANRVEDFMGAAFETIKKSCRSRALSEAMSKLIIQADSVSLNGLAELIALQSLDDAWKQTCSLPPDNCLDIILERAHDCLRRRAVASVKEMLSVQLDSDIEAQLKELRNAHIRSMGCVLDCVVRKPPRT